MQANPRLCVIALCVLTCARAHAQDIPLHPEAGVGYYRFPTVSGNTVVFTAEGDLWRVPLTGGLAQRLTTHAGEETRASISPDGKTVAFSATYEGPTEAYTMPLDGGPPTRRTYDGSGARVIGWTPDGKLMYATSAPEGSLCSKYSTLPTIQLQLVDLSSSMRTAVPLAQAADGAYAPDGTLYFTRFDWQGSHTKRYRGGTAQSIWRYATSGVEATPVTSTYLGTSKSPMVFGGRLYFASDRTSAASEDSKPGVMNIWSSKLDGTDLRRHTDHTMYDVQNPSQNGGRIVYENGGDIWTIPLDVGGRPGAPQRLRRLLLAGDITSEIEYVAEEEEYFGPCVVVRGPRTRESQILAALFGEDWPDAASDDLGEN